MTLQNDFLNDIQGMYPHVPWENVVYSVNISLKHRYIYVETPKCACSTIKLSLQRLELDDPSFTRRDFEYVHFRAHSPLLNPRQVPSFRSLCEDPRFFKFCVVRHPASRLLSVYLDKIMRNKQEKVSILRQLGLSDIAMSTPVSFEQFIRAVCEQPFSMMDHHWSPQYYQTLQDSIRYDHVGRFETLDFSIEEIITRVGEHSRTFFVAEMRHKTDANLKLDEYLTPELLSLIHGKFHIDYDYFKYEITPQ